MTTYQPIGIMSVLNGPNVDLMALIRQLESFDRNLGAILNHGLSFGDNVDAVTVSFTSSATPDAENTVSHSLGKVPNGFIITSLDKAGTVYKGTTAFTKSNIYLKCNVASVAVKALVF